MATCDQCGKEVVNPFKCNYCGGTFCSKHKLPPNHDCPNIEAWESRSGPSIGSHEKPPSWKAVGRLPETKPSPVNSKPLRESRQKKPEFHGREESENEGWWSKKKIVGIAIISFFGFVALGVLTPDEKISSGRETGSEGSSNYTRLENMVYQLINKERREHGLSPLKWDGKLSDVARKHSSDMAKQDFFSHTNLQGEDLSDRITDAAIDYQTTGEIIAKQPDKEGTVYIPIPIPISKSKGEITQDTVEGWMNSPGHREIILTSQYQRIGVGAWKAGDYYYFTGDFVG